METCFQTYKHTYVYPPIFAIRYERTLNKAANHTPPPPIRTLMTAMMNRISYEFSIFGKQCIFLLLFPRNIFHTVEIILILSTFRTPNLLFHCEFGCIQLCFKHAVPRHCKFSGFFMYLIAFDTWVILS